MPPPVGLGLRVSLDLSSTGCPQQDCPHVGAAGRPGKDASRDAFGEARVGLVVDAESDRDVVAVDQDLGERHPQPAGPISEAGGVERSVSRPEVVEDRRQYRDVALERVDQLLG